MSVFLHLEVALLAVSIYQWPFYCEVDWIMTTTNKNKYFNSCLLTEYKRHLIILRLWLSARWRTEDKHKRKIIRLTWPLAMLVQLSRLSDKERVQQIYINKRIDLKIFVWTFLCHILGYVQWLHHSSGAELLNWQNSMKLVVICHVMNNYWMTHELMNILWIWTYSEHIMNNNWTLNDQFIN